MELQIPRKVLWVGESFESAWPGAIGGRSKGLMELVPRLYEKGMSQRDMETALIEALGVEPTGRSVVNEVCRSLRMDFEGGQEREILSSERVFLSVGGRDLSEGVGPEEKGAALFLCAYGRGSGMVREGIWLHRAVGETRRAAPLGRL